MLSAQVRAGGGQAVPSCMLESAQYSEYHEASPMTSLVSAGAAGGRRLGLHSRTGQCDGFVRQDRTTGRLERAAVPLPPSRATATAAAAADCRASARQRRGRAKEYS